MTKKKVFKRVLILIGIILVIGGGVAYYMFNMPHRDVQTAKTDFTLKASEIVNEYLSDPDAANEKYLDSEGESKILEVTGTIAEITEDFNNNKVVRLKSITDKSGISCTFSTETNSSTHTLKIGEKVTIKGVIRSGASFDSDLEMYEDVIMEKCDLISNK